MQDRSRMWMKKACKQEGGVGEEEGGGVTLAKPKSPSLTKPCKSMKTFSGLRSRYTMLLWWRYSRASTMEAM